MTDVQLVQQMHAPDWEPQIGGPVRAEDVLALQDYFRHVAQYRLRRVAVFSWWGSDWTDNVWDPYAVVSQNSYRSANNPSRVIILAEPRFPYDSKVWGAKTPPIEPEQVTPISLQVSGYAGTVTLNSPPGWDDNLQDVMCWTEYPEDDRTSTTAFASSSWGVRATGSPRYFPASLRIEWQPTTTGKVGT